MLSFLATIFVFVSVESSLPNYEPLNHPYLENNISPHETSNRKSLLSNRVIECDMEDIFKIVGLNDIQELIESLAARKGTTPFSIVRMLQKRMKNKEEMEENLFNTIDKDIISPPMPPNEAIYSVPSQAQKDDVVIIPSQNSLPNRLPPILKTDFLSRNEEPRIFGQAVGRMSPDMFALPTLKNNQFSATVRVNVNDPISTLTGDIKITVSPLMTLIEALRQAEMKYQNILGLNHGTDVFNFSYLPIMDCYVINQVADVVTTEEHAWKVTISDRDNQVVYSNFCLPSGRDALVKPGTLISLSYVPHS